jgi:hypothetical protein
MNGLFIIGIRVLILGLFFFNFFFNLVEGLDKRFLVMIIDSLNFLLRV